MGWVEWECVDTMEHKTQVRGQLARLCHSSAIWFGSVCVGMDQTQVFRLGGRDFYLLSHPPGF